MKTLDWLRLLLMIFYAPGRGLREVRDRAPLAASALVAVIAHGIFFFCITLLYVRDQADPRRPAVILSVILESAGSVVIVALVFCPLALFDFEPV